MQYRCNYSMQLFDAINTRCNYSMQYRCNIIDVAKFFRIPIRYRALHADWLVFIDVAKFFRLPAGLVFIDYLPGLYSLITCRACIHWLPAGHFMHAGSNSFFRIHPAGQPLLRYLNGYIRVVYQSCISELYIRVVYQRYLIRIPSEWRIYQRWRLRGNRYSETFRMTDISEAYIRRHGLYCLSFLLRDVTVYIVWVFCSETSRSILFEFFAQRRHGLYCLSFLLRDVTVYINKKPICLNWMQCSSILLLN
jgi:hypothetical protein